MPKFWYLTMAWRDGRAHLKRFFLFTISITVGIAALVSVQSFGDAIEDAINEQSKSLLGADLVFESSFPSKDFFKQALDTVSYEEAEQVQFASMVFAPKTDLSRLVQVRAIQGNFPFYGEMRMSDPSRNNGNLKENEVYIDDNLSHLLSIGVNDSLKVGAQTFIIKALVEKMPGEAAVAAFAGPRVFIALSELEKTGLIQKGSRITYQYYYKLDKANELFQALNKDAEEKRIRIQTVESRKRSIGSAMDNLYSFLNLVGFIALLLGAVGVGSSVQVYAKQKKNTIAILRCLGLSSIQALRIFIIQLILMGFFGAITGTLLGVSIVPLFPFIFSDFLPVAIDTSISLTALGKGFGLGLLFTFLFALIPLLQARRTSPLATLRIAETPLSVWTDFLHWITVSSITATLFTFSFLQTKSILSALAFSLGLAVAFLLLTSVAKLLMVAVRKFFPSGASFEIRQGLANLYRPNNQTLLLLVSIGLGAFLIMTLLQTQYLLINQLDITSQQSQTNMVLFDVQTDQVETAEQILIQNGMKLNRSTPIVGMRLEQMGQRKVTDMLSDSTLTIRKWALRREYRSSYRSELAESEKLIEGEFIGEWNFDNQPIPITVEKQIVGDLNLSLGDTLTWDVQGVSVQTFISGIREVDWQRVEPNFYVIFPSGILEAAPQFWVMLTHFDSQTQSIAVKKVLVNQIPNVSVIDLDVILDTVDSILSKISIAIQFMALFSMVTGMVVLISSLFSTRFQRIRESVLLRTLGALKNQIQKILIYEFLFVGFLATATGLVLSMAATWSLAHFVFNSTYTPNFVYILSGFFVICGFILFIGFMNSRGLLDTPPLEVLRNEE